MGETAAEMHVHLVINPAAGRRSSVPYCAAVAHELTGAGHTVTQYVTKAPGDGTRHVAGLSATHCDVLGIVGGDGTLGEVVQGRGLGGAGEFPWPLALIPMGTANLVAREMRMPLGGDPKATADALAQGTPWPVDLMAFAAAGSDRTCAVANVGIGADAQVVATIDRLRRGAVASGSYLRWIRPILGTIRRFSSTPLRVVIDDNVTHYAAACVVQNARSYGGVFQLSPDAGLASGALDVVVLRARTGRDLFRVGVQALLRRVPSDKAVRMYKADHVEVSARSPVAVQADGDPAGSTDLRVSRQARALTLWRGPATD